MERGTTPSPKVKPIIHLCGRPIDNANVMFYFKLSNTLRTAADAISGVTVMYEYNEVPPLSTLWPRMKSIILVPMPRLNAC